MSEIRVNNLTFYYEESFDHIFDEVSFHLDSNWKLGFIGRNGRGKTTFLKLLMGKYEYKGKIESNLAFDYFPFFLTEEEKRQETLQIIERIKPDYEFWKVCRELSLLQMPEDIFYRPYETLSNGEQTKVMLAVLFSKENQFLLIDEPTNHLDQETREIVKSYLSKKKSFILVSHDRDLLDACVDHVLVLNKNTITVEQGNFTSWWENKKRQDEYELEQNVKLKKDIRHLSEASKRNKNWSDQVEASKIGNHAADRGAIGHKAAKMMKRAKAVEHQMEKAKEKKEKLLKNIETTEELKIIPLLYEKNVLIRTKELGLFYDKKKIADGIELEISNQECVVLQGKNGCGKSSLLKKILGEKIESSGLLEIGSGIKISYIPQDTSYLKGSLDDYIRENKLEESLDKALLRKLDLGRIQFQKRLEEYSEGQKKKVLIAKSLCESAHLYIWDEPLNYIDIFSRIQIEELILQYKPTLLMVEHDISFIEKVADKIIKIERIK